MSANVHAIAATRLPENFRLRSARVDLNANVVTSRGVEHRITPKAAAVMRMLAAQPGRAMTRDELLQSVWADAFPTDDVLSHAITELRRALGDDARNSRYIETIPKVGYRLLCTPEPLAAENDEAEAAGPAGTSWLSRVATFALGLLVGAMAVGLWMDRGKATAPASPSDPLADAFPVSAQPGPEFMPAVSADGRRVAFVASPAAGEPTDIMVKALIGESPVNVTQTRGAFEYSPVWSPDGERVAFLRFADGECRVIVRPVDGGLEQDLVACISDAITYVDWSPDGQSLAVTHGDETIGVSRIHLVDVQTGERRPLDYTLTDEHDVQPKFSPDGSQLVFRRGVNPRSELFLVASAGGAPRQLTDFGSRIYGFDWLPDGRRVWFCAEREGAPALFEVAIDSPVIQPVSSQCTYGLSVATVAGTLAFVEHSGSANLSELSIVGDAAPPDWQSVFVSTRSDHAPAYSPDGRSVVFVSDRSGEDQLWLGDRETGAANQLTRLAGLSLGAPVFGSDGEHVLFVGQGGGSESLFRVSLRSGIVERVSGPDERVRAGALGPDGAVYLSSDRSGSWQLWRSEGDTGAATRLTTSAGHRPVVPGDGHVYFTRLDYYGLWRVPVTGGEEALVSDLITFANHEAWVIRDGALFVPVPASEVDPQQPESVVIMRVPLDGVGESEIVTRFSESEGAKLADVSPDGRTLLFTRMAEGQEDISAVTGL